MPPRNDIVPPPFTPPAEYYQRLESDFQRLDIAGIDNDRAFEIPLSEIYVRLRVIFDEDVQADANEVQDSGPLDIQTALLRYPKLVIVGDPGSGKSTFLKYIALMIARSALQANPGIALETLCLQEPLPIPLFISCWDLSDFLKKFDRIDLPRLIEFLAQRLQAYGFRIQVDNLENLLKTGSCCLLFDGLDEIPTENGRAAVSRLLEECVRRFPGNRFVVTSRIRAYTGDTMLQGEFTRCDIQPFDENDRRQFLRN
jgi:predicted NACHT family NTPase